MVGSRAYRNIYGVVCFSAGWTSEAVLSGIIILMLGILLVV